MPDTGTMDTIETAEKPQRNTKARLREQTATVGRDVRELGKLTKEASQETLEQAKHTASEYLDKGQKRAQELEETIVGYVREKPVRSLLIAAGAGAVLGFLLNRR